MAEAWRVVSHGGQLLFMRPFVTRYGHAQEDLLPSADAVAAFLTDVFDSQRFDLFATHPFGWLLHALFHGTNYLPRCGSSSYRAFATGGDCFGCEHRSEPVPAPKPTEHDCHWPAFCELLAAPCEAVRRTEPRMDSALSEVLFCKAVHSLMPRILDAFMRATRFEMYLRNRTSEDRFRIAAKDGAARVWTEKVIADHRNRFEEAPDANGNAHDLSWIRSRTSGDRVADEPAGRAAEAPA